ncbi:cobalamin-binding protein [Sphingomonas spermidinifaciens]|uniref:Cobalamin-binding protein n=1 Tax=Sphingomonas spermidinifaciens TaxID=1141889 RepID=A0A2A4B7M3_9SPHN|nr:cobalamin-dependent protein [Sphingomonas spermidinifaciens]PCD03646.1 cobalamin-binding protein [Sphingomonas spermidinifaciens]
MATLAPMKEEDGRRPRPRPVGFRSIAGERSPVALSALIEGEIIPRLMVAHHAATPAVAPGTAHEIDARDIAALAPMTLEVEADVLLAHVQGLMTRGISIDSVLIDLLAPTARLLGEWWEADRCDFVEVTMGLWRLQEVVHEICDGAPPTLRAAPRPKALFAAMPGDQHSFGAVIVDELFRRNGWSTDRWIGEAAAGLQERVRMHRFDLIGLTISCDCHIAALPPLIADLRTVSRNPKVSVMVGGRVFVEDPSLATSVGADGTARDARLALSVATHLVRARAGEVADAD